jgi:DNA-binding CsgD family transcriptional regulator
VITGAAPVVVVEGTDADLAAVRAELERAGWRTVDAGWTGPPRPAPDQPTGPPAGRGSGVVRVGVVAGAGDAGHAVLAVLAGDGLLVAACAERDVVDRLCEDLRRLGPVRHVLAGPAEPRLSTEQRALLRLLLDGATLGSAARQLNLSRRTADRRLAAIRGHYGVGSTAEALLAAHRRGDAEE